MKRYVIKFLLFLLKKLGMAKGITIDYYHNVNGNWDFLRRETYNKRFTTPNTGQKVKLFANGHTTLYTVVDVIYDGDNIMLHIQ